MKIEDDVKLDFSDVLIKPKRSKLSSRSEVSLERTFKFLNSKKEWNGIPIFAANMDTVGTFSMSRNLSKQKISTCLHKHYKAEEYIEFFKDEVNLKYSWYTSGILEDDISKMFLIIEKTNIDKVCIDVANGYSENFLDKIKKIREKVKDKVSIMVGNVVTPEMVETLLISGAADIIKVGIGSGKVCRTRVVTGVGYPQLSAVIECADAAHGLGGHICSDGGCSLPGDLSKAFGAGSDFVMLGSMLSGCDESECEIIEKNNGDKFIKFYGMSSKEAMMKYKGKVEDYRASEGACIETPYKGSVESIVKEILGGIRSTCTYVGTSNLKNLSKCTTFIRCNRVH